MSKILIIDDEVQIRSLLARMLGLEGYEVCVRRVIARQLSGSWKFNSRMWLCVMSFFPMETGSIWC